MTAPTLCPYPLDALDRLEAAINRPALVTDVVEMWLKRAPERRTVVFVTSVATQSPSPARFRTMA